MKKLLAVLLALVLALSCTLAMAESTDTAATTDTTATPAFPGLTIESSYDVNREALANLLTQMGLDEGLVKIIDAVAAIADEAGEKLVIANDGVQAEVLLKDNTLVNVLALFDQTDLTLGSNLIPNYALKISFEEIGEMLLSKVQEQNDILNSLDVPAIQEALTNYINDYINTCTAAIIPGEVQQGDFVMDGVSYNIMMPMKVDLPTIVDATNELIYNVSNDETIQTALVQLALMGVEVNFEGVEDGYTIVDPAYLPAVNVEVYMNMNEKGEQSDPTQVNVTVVPAGETAPATTVITKVNGNNVTVDCEFISGKDKANVIYAMDRDPQDPFGVNCRVDAYVNDFYLGFAAVTASNDQAITFDAYAYVQDTEKAIAEEHGSITLNGEITLGVADGATVLTLADLTGESGENALSGVVMDLLFNGLGNVVSTASNLMPDEVGLISSVVNNLYTSLMGGESEAAQPAADADAQPAADADAQPAADADAQPAA